MNFSTVFAFPLAGAGRQREHGQLLHAAPLGALRQPAGAPSQRHHPRQEKKISEFQENQPRPQDEDSSQKRR